MILDDKRYKIEKVINRFERISRRSELKQDYASSIKAGKVALDYFVDQKKETPEEETIWDKDKLISLLDYLEKQLEQP